MLQFFRPPCHLCNEGNNVNTTTGSKSDYNRNRNCGKCDVVSAASRWGRTVVDKGDVDANRECDSSCSEEVKECIWCSMAEIFKSGETAECEDYITHCLQNNLSENTSSTSESTASKSTKNIGRQKTRSLEPINSHSHFDSFEKGSKNKRNDVSGHQFLPPKSILFCSDSTSTCSKESRKEFNKEENGVFSQQEKSKKNSLFPSAGFNQGNVIYYENSENELLYEEPYDFQSSIGNQLDYKSNPILSRNIVRHVNNKLTSRPITAREVKKTEIASPQGLIYEMLKQSPDLGNIKNREPVKASIVINNQTSNITRACKSSAEKLLNSDLDYKTEYGFNQASSSAKRRGLQHKPKEVTKEVLRETGKSLGSDPTLCAQRQPTNAADSNATTSDYGKPNVISKSSCSIPQPFTSSSLGPFPSAGCWQNEKLLKDEPSLKNKSDLQTSLQSKVTSEHVYGRFFAGSRPITAKDIKDIKVSRKLLESEQGEDKRDGSSSTEEQAEQSVYPSTGAIGSKAVEAICRWKYRDEIEYCERCDDKVELQKKKDLTCTSRYTLKPDKVNHGKGQYDLYKAVVLTLRQKL